MGGINAFIDNINEEMEAMLNNKNIEKAYKTRIKNRKQRKKKKKPKY